MVMQGGFWSYVHADDSAEGRRITRLAELIQTEYGLLSGGEEIEIFVDRNGIRWGDEWRARINNALGDTTFFIPIVTPRYFKSAECRKELLVFAGHAESLGVKELLLPILYVPVADLTEDSEDEAIRLIARTQYVRWSDLRLEDQESMEYRRAVNALATRLRHIVQLIESRPEATPASVETVIEEIEEDLGILDSTALGEQVMLQWVQSLQDLTSIMQEMVPIVATSSEQMAMSGTAGAQLAVAQRFAQELDDPSTTFLSAATDYANSIVNLDPAMRRIIRAARDHELADSESDINELFETIKGVVAQTQAIANNAVGLRQNVAAAGRLTRLLHVPLGRLQSGAQRIEDAQTILNEWDRQIPR